MGWLPDGIVMRRLGFRANTNDVWMGQLVSSQANDGEWVWSVMRLPETPAPDSDRGRWMTVSIGTVTPAPPNGGEALTVRGRPARMVEASYSPGRWCLVVDLGEGLQLTVCAYLGGPDPLTKQDLIRTAEHAEIDPTPNPGIGSR